MSRIIFHVDMNSFYAAVECMYRPEERHLPLAVGGDAKRRHGIILAKNEYAKRFGIKTGEALWQAKQKCPTLQIVPPDYPLYMRYSSMAKNIYLSYTPRVESFGLDECWLDVSGREMDYSQASILAQELHERIIDELGVTISIGVSWNKVFAKLGSDMNKPDGTVIITPDNFKQRIWPLPVHELLYVGPATTRKFVRNGIYTIGDLANCSTKWLQESLGKVGIMLQHFARGEDQSEVSEDGQEEVIKSVGNSVTTPRDIIGDEDVKLIFYALAESVAARLREQGFETSCISISLRDTNLFTFAWQKSLSQATNLTLEIANAAMALYYERFPDKRPFRSLGLRAEKLSHTKPEQINFMPDKDKREQYARIDYAIDSLRKRFGYVCVRRAYLLTDDLGRLDAKGSHVIAPISFLKGGDRICSN